MHDSILSYPEEQTVFKKLLGQTAFNLVKDLLKQQGSKDSSFTVLKYSVGWKPRGKWRENYGGAQT